MRAISLPIVLCVFWAILTGSVHAADDKPADGMHRVVLKTTFKIAPTTRTTRVVMKVQIPVSQQGRQTVHDVKFSRRPTRTYRKSGFRYADFEWRSIDKLVELTQTVEADVRAYDLRRARALAAKPKALSADERRRYTRHEKLFEVNDAKIQEIARDLDGKEEVEIVENISNLVSARLKYIANPSQQIGAAEVLRVGRGACSDYSALMISLCRARGIPARAACGLVARNPTPGRHAWVEVYLKDLGWVPFDPTIASTAHRSFDELQPCYVYLTDDRRNGLGPAFNGVTVLSWGGQVALSESHIFESK